MLPGESKLPLTGTTFKRYCIIFNVYNGEGLMAETESQDLPARLAGIRNRRMFLWLVFASYIPAIWFALKIGGDTLAAVVAILWLSMSATGGVLVSFAICPRCGNRFHMKGISTSWGSRCVHCKLSLSEGK